MQQFLRQQESFQKVNDYHKKKRVEEEMTKVRDILERQAASTTCDSDSDEDNNSTERKQVESLGNLMSMNEDNIPMGMVPDREYSVDELLKMNYWKRLWYHNFTIRKHFETQRQLKKQIKQLQSDQKAVEKVKGEITENAKKIYALFKEFDDIMNKRMTKWIEVSNKNHQLSDKLEIVHEKLALPPPVMVKQPSTYSRECSHSPTKVDQQARYLGQLQPDLTGTLSNIQLKAIENRQLYK